MFKMLGKIYVIILFVSTFYAHAGITLRALTTNGEQLDSATMGQPFTLEVVVDGGQGSATPFIDNIEKFVVRRTGMYMSINGVSTTRYQIRIDVPGEYTIGPARLKLHNQQEIASNVLIVRVGTENSASHYSKGKKSKGSQSESKAFLRLQVDKDSVVVGQKIIGTLRFFYQDPDLKLTHIGQPDIADFDMKQVDTPLGGMTEINGVQYRYAEWKWDMYPTAAGEFIIPAYSADYEMLDKEKNVQSKLFLFFNTTRMEQKRIYSNAIKITVASLPHYNGRVDAIGSFENMTATIKPPMAKLGEGVIFALEIEGNGNWDAINAPQLSMPSELKYYESKKEQLPTKKRFEFVVQGLRAGDWEIPEQTFTFFDTEKMMYKTLRSPSLLVTIMPGNAAQYNESAGHVLDKGFQSAQLQVEDIRPLNEHGEWYSVSKALCLPWFVMQVATLLPLFFILFLFVREKIVLMCRYSPRIRKKRAFRRARKALELCCLDGDSTRLYAIFTQFFVDCYAQSYQVNVDNAICIEYVRVKMSEDLQKEWDDFFAAITQAAFGSDENNNGYGLCQEAQLWINRLENFF